MSDVEVRRKAWFFSLVLSLFAADHATLWGLACWFLLVGLGSSQERFSNGIQSSSSFGGAREELVKP